MLLRTFNFIPESLLRLRPLIFGMLLVRLITFEIHEATIPIVFNYISFLSLVLKNIHRHTLLVILTFFFVVQSVGSIFLILVVTLNIEPVCGNVDHSNVGYVNNVISGADDGWYKEIYNK